jgi:ribosomal protein S18 acetylase RimI-like enzyme
MIPFIEELAANAWRPEIEQVVDGWRLRYTRGITRRGNSVLPIAHGGSLSLDEKLAIAEDFYARWGEPSCFQLTQAAQPAGLLEVLKARGYQDGFHTQVQTVPVLNVLQKTAQPPDFQITIEDHMPESWFDLCIQIAGYGEPSADARHGILTRIGPKVGFALLSIEGEPIAIGLGALERGWVGLFCMETRPEFRRQGAASALLHALADWSQGQKASQIYLQVMEDNSPALSLYAKAGFEKQYQYWYAQKDHA